MAVNSAPSKFSWEGLGDVDEGRQSLGTDMPVIIYRLFQYTLRNVLENQFGKESASVLFREAGLLAGKEFAAHTLDLSGDFDFFVANLQKQLFDMKIGILNIEKADLATLSLTLTVSEDLDCSGLPVTDDTVCDYDEGFIAGILETFTGKQFSVREVDCWATGDRTCRFCADIT